MFFATAKATMANGGAGGVVGVVGGVGGGVGLPADQVDRCEGIPCGTNCPKFP